jgi:hypothetical protein
MTEYAMPPTPDGVDEFAWRAAVSTIRGYCEWHIAPSVTETVTVDGAGDGILLLPTLYLTGLTAVTDDGTVIADSEIQWSQRGAVRRGTQRYSCYRWTNKYRGIAVTMTHGYTDFPHEVLAVARDMARAGDRVGASAFTSGPHQVQYGVTSAGTQAGAVGMSDLQKSVLARYRIPGRP